MQIDIKIQMDWTLWIIHWEFRWWIQIILFHFRNLSEKSYLKYCLCCRKKIVNLANISKIFRKEIAENVPAYFLLVIRRKLIIEPNHLVGEKALCLMFHRYQDSYQIFFFTFIRYFWSFFSDIFGRFSYIFGLMRHFWTFIRYFWTFIRYLWTLSDISGLYRIFLDFIGYFWTLWDIFELYQTFLDVYEIFLEVFRIFLDFSTKNCQAVTVHKITKWLFNSADCDN